MSVAAHCAQAALDSDEFVPIAKESFDDLEQPFEGGARRIRVKEVSLVTVALTVFQSEGEVNLIKLKVLSNHGSAEYTCIYRVEVHSAE